MNSVKNVVISGYYGFENFGDEAILKVLTSKNLKRFLCDPVCVLQLNSRN